MTWLARSRGLGYIRDEADPRDKYLALKSASLPSSFSLAHPAVTPRNQGSTSSCVGFAWAQAIELAYAHQGILTGDISPRFLYFLARASHGSAGQDSGTYLRSAAKAAVRFGAASESAMPFSRLLINSAPPWRAYRDAFDRKGVRGYYRIAQGDTNAVKVAIAAGLPVVGGWSVDRAFADYTDGILPKRTGESLGGHALCVMAYAQNSFMLINSWGTSYGAGGYCLVSPEWLAQGSDLWACDVRGAR